MMIEIAKNVIFYFLYKKFLYKIKNCRYSMKKLIVLTSCILVMFSLCSCSNTNLEVESLKQEIATLKQENESLRNNQNDNVIEASSTQNDTLTEPDNLNKENSKIIWEFVKPEIAGKLNQPTTAEFSDISKVKFYKLADDTYEVLGAVKGQNALGNIVSNDFYATVITDSKGQPTIVSNMEFLGETSYKERIEVNEQLQNRAKNGVSYLTAEELAIETLKQPLYVKETKFLDSTSFSYSSSSMLQALLYNNSDIPIKNANLAFVAWDKNGLPIKIEEYSGASDGAYFSKIKYDTINLMPQDTYIGLENGTYSGMTIDKNLQIFTLKSIVISYEDFDGNTWENPLLLDFKNLYEEKRFLD